MGAAHVFAANLPGEVWQNAGNHRWATFCHTFSDRGSNKMHHFHAIHSGTPIDGRSLCWNHASWFAKMAPCSPNSWPLGLFSLTFTNGTTLISNDLVKWLKLSRVEAAGAFDSAMHLTRLGHFWCQRAQYKLQSKGLAVSRAFPAPLPLYNRHVMYALNRSKWNFTAIHILVPRWAVRGANVPQSLGWLASCLQVSRSSSQRWQ